MMNKIIFGKPDIRKEDIDTVVAALKSGWIGMGFMTKLLEKAFLQLTRAKYAVAVSSGSVGLFISMITSGISKGDEVITSPMTFPATANEIIHTGADVKFVDVDDNGNIDASKIGKAITKRTKAIIPIHLYGRPCDMDSIVDIAGKHKLFVIEDAAHALGAKYKSKSIGNIGNAAVFSLYATKNITSAEGGVITTNNKGLADKLRLLRSYGITKTSWERFKKTESGIPYDTVLPGYNFEIPDVLSAIALSQIHTYSERTARRRYIWEQYDTAFKTLPIGLPDAGDIDHLHAMHLYTIMIDKKRTGIDRKTFIHKLNNYGIGTGIHFISLHLHSYYKKKYGYSAYDFPHALKISNQTLSLPLTSGMTDQDVNRVINAVRRLCNG
ncbi:MAG: DegT/DnrJ/EryC1/StrS family aminotransferase [Deltaproteobacteria bacterium]|nr:DegT/DnrJ/EryC1/StrS family aminotransferase [Deltaproteobacteria bacterium]